MEKESMKEKKILVIDDDVDILEGISIILEAQGYIVKTIEKGDHVYQVVQKFRPDLILLDVMLSSVDGREICLSIKRSDSVKDIPMSRIDRGD